MFFRIVLYSQETAEDTKVYDINELDSKPNFEGGLTRFYFFIVRNYIRPENENIKNGNVFLEFIIEKDGSITNINCLRDLGYGTCEEGIRVLCKCPNFIPGKKNEVEVRTKYKCAITIQ